MSEKVNRHRIRYEPGSLDYALVEFEPQDGNFHPGTVALIVNESYSGVSLVLKTQLVIQVGLKLRVKIGDLEPMDALVMWVRELEENIYRFGIQYVD